MKKQFIFLSLLLIFIAVSAFAQNPVVIHKTIMTDTVITKDTLNFGMKGSRQVAIENIGNSIVIIYIPNSSEQFSDSNYVILNGRFDKLKFTFTGRKLIFKSYTPGASNSINIYINDIDYIRFK